MSALAASAPDAEPDDLEARLRHQRAAFHAELPVAPDIRRDRLRRAIDLLVRNEDRFVDALSADYGHRSPTESRITDIMATVKPLRHALAHVDRWMKPEKRKVERALWLFGARARVEYQPKGVVGVIAPWNFPVHLTFTPLAQIFAAGNRAMVKPSEHTPATSALMAELCAAAYDPAELVVVTGGAEVGQRFARLPFDHLIFTGGATVARHILRAAAEHLVPTTLELGGKSPVVIGRGADLTRAAERIAAGKMLNAGQVCLAPDYVLVPAAREAAFVDALRAAVAAMWPEQVDHPDCTAIIDARNHARLVALLDDARAAGAEVVALNPGDEDFTAAAAHQMPLHLVRRPDATMRVMREEIFGPILPIVPYDRVDDAIDHIVASERPLALYHFGDDATERRRLLDRTLSGGVTLDDVIFHGTTEDLPFGGIGASGMGTYHGFDGFRNFSHARAIYHQPRFDIARLAGFKPPYGDRTAKTLRREISG